MKINFKNNYIIILLLALLIFSCFCFVKMSVYKEGFESNYSLPAASNFFKYFEKQSNTDTSYSYYLLNKYNTYYKLKDNNLNIDACFNILTSQNITKSSNELVFLSENRYNVFYTDTNNYYYRHYTTPESYETPTIDLSSSNGSPTIEEFKLLVLIKNSQNTGDKLEVYDLSDNILNINLTIDNISIIENGLIVDSSKIILETSDNVVETSNIAVETSNNALTIDDLPPALVSQLLGINQFGDTITTSGDTTTNNIDLKAYGSGGITTLNSNYMLSNTPNFSYNSPYYNNSFEYAMNSLSNPHVNSSSLNPLEVSQMMLDPKNVKDVCTTYDNCYKKDRETVNGTTTGTTSETTSGTTSVNNTEKYISDTNTANIQNSINESSKSNSQNSNLNSNMTMFNNDTNSYENSSQTNFTPSGTSSEIDSSLPRPVLADFSNF